MHSGNETAPPQGWRDDSPGRDSTPQQPQQRVASRPKDNRGFKALIAILIVLLLLLLAFLVPISNGDTLYDMIEDELFDPFSPSIPAYADYVITRTIDISVSGGNIDYSLDIPLPREISSNQNSPIQVINDLDVTPASHEIYEKYWNDWAYWNGSTDSGFTATITYDMRVYSVVLDFGREDTGSIYDMPDDLDRYLDDEWKIEPSLDSVSTLATSLTSGTNNVYAMVEAIYDHMRNEFTYDTNSPGEPKSCTQTLSDGRGDCDDQSILFISMLRSVGIPAWLEFGPLYDPTTNEWGAHAWSKVYVPLAGGGGGTVTVDVVNGQFMVKDCSRFTEWESDGNEEHLEDYYHTLSYSYIPPQPGIEITDSYQGNYRPSEDTIKLP